MNSVLDLSTKTLVMIVGPSAIGKSTIMNQVVKESPLFSRVKSFTTRPPRANDEPDHYIYLRPGELPKLINSGEVISQVVYPTTGQTYGTLISSYPNNYNLLDTLANSVRSYRQLPFQETVTVSLTAPADSWHRWFLGRYPNPTEEAEMRLEEAKLSIKWSMNQRDKHRWVINDGDVPTVAKKLIKLSTHQSGGDSGEADAHAILESIERGVWLNKK